MQLTVRNLVCDFLFVSRKRNRMYRVAHLETPANEAELTDTHPNSSLRVVPLSRCDLHIWSQLFRRTGWEDHLMLEV